MSLEDKIQQVKAKEWSDEDRDLIASWDKIVADTSIDEEYLKHPRTQAIVAQLKGMIEEIDNSVKVMTAIKPDELWNVNDILSRKQAYITLLTLYKADEDFTAIREHLESEVDNALNI